MAQSNRDEVHYEDALLIDWLGFHILQWKPNALGIFYHKGKHSKDRYEVWNPLESLDDCHMLEVALEKEGLDIAYMVGLGDLDKDDTLVGTWRAYIFSKPRERCNVIKKIWEER